MFKKLFCLLLLAPMAWAQQPSTAATPAAAELRLDDVVREVLSANPSLGRAAILIDAQRAHAGQAGVLPDPSFTLSWMGNAVPFQVQDNDPSSYRGFSFMQMVPLGHKLRLQREVARKDVAVEEVSRTAAERDLVTEAKAAFFDYRYYGLALEITARNRQSLEQLAEIAEARYRVGKAMQQDVLQARLQISMLLQRTAALEQQRLTSAARLNTLMGRFADSPLAAAAAEDGLTPLPALETLAPLAEANDPMLARETSMEKRESAALALSRKDSTPDLNVGYMVQQRTGNPTMQGAQFTVNLPLHRDRLRQEVAEGELRVRAAQQGEQARRLEASYELRQAYAAAQTARQMSDLYDKAILPQAELARDSAQASYTVGNVDFLTVVTNYTAIYSYELDNRRQRADYEIAIARIEGLTGDLNSLDTTPNPAPNAGPSTAPAAPEAQ
ncbi:MAG: TolC family protein [Candidatus Korobacteraceae bacterium]